MKRVKNHLTAQTMEIALTFHHQQRAVHRYGWGDRQGPPRLVLRNTTGSNAPLGREKLDCRRKNDMALSRLKMGASIRADVPNS